MDISGYAALAAKQALQPFHYKVFSLLPEDVEVDITHCGICHSDLHLIDNDWHISHYPFIPGHEIIGIICNVGQKVKNLVSGQRVGIGWQCDCCRNCEWCKKNEENLCSAQKATCVNKHGGFAKKIRVHNRFAFPIPQEIPSHYAAPLLCGGITVYSPLREHTVSGMHVGIVGIGGLGHMAIKFSRAMGHKVTAFSSSLNKESEILEMGAHHFILNTDKAALAQVKNSLDFILSTVSATVDWMPYINALRPRGKLCIVSGLATTPLNVPVFSLIEGRKSIVGSNIGNCNTIKEMLAFAAIQQIFPQVEVMNMSEVNQALDKVRTNKARYRIVLTNQK